MFKSIIFSALISIISTAAAFSQTAPTWQKVTSEAGQFEAFFPAAPKSDFKKVKTVSGNYADMTSYVAAFATDVYFVTYSDYTEAIPDPKAALLRSQEGALSKTNSLIFSTPTTFMGYSALDYQVRADFGIIVTIKAVLVGQRLYQVAAARSETSSTASDNAKFISSFRLKIPSGVARR